MIRRLKTANEERDAALARLKQTETGSDGSVVDVCRRFYIYNKTITVFQLGWEKGRVQKKLGTI